MSGARSPTRRADLVLTRRARRRRRLIRPHCRRHLLRNPPSRAAPKPPPGRARGRRVAMCPPVPMPHLPPRSPASTRLWRPIAVIASTPTASPPGPTRAARSVRRPSGGARRVDWRLARRLARRAVHRLGGTSLVFGRSSNVRNRWLARGSVSQQRSGSAVADCFF